MTYFFVAHTAWSVNFNVAALTLSVPMLNVILFGAECLFAPVLLLNLAYPEPYNRTRAARLWTVVGALIISASGGISMLFVLPSLSIASQSFPAPSPYPEITFTALALYLLTVTFMVLRLLRRRARHLQAAREG